MKMKFDTRNLFRAAWKIARVAADRFGGSPRQYFAASLKCAYAEARNRVTSAVVIATADRVETTGKAAALYMFASPFGRSVVGDKDFVRIAGYRAKSTYQPAERAEINEMFKKYIIPLVN